MLFKLRKLKWVQTCDLTSSSYANLTTCKAGINISKVIPEHKCPFHHIAIFGLLEKMLSPLLPYRCESQESTTVWCPSLAPLYLASLLGRGGTEVIKTPASPSVRAQGVSGLLLLWRCRLAGFLPYEVIVAKTKIRYQRVCHLSTIPSVFPIRLVPHRGFKIFTRRG